MCLFLYFLEVESTCVRSVIESSPETQRWATQHDCLPRLLGAETKKAKKCAVKKIIFCTGLTRAGQKSIVLARQAQRSNQGRTPFYVLQESPFASVSTAGVKGGASPPPFTLSTPFTGVTPHPSPSPQHIAPLCHRPSPLAKLARRQAWPDL